MNNPRQSQPGRTGNAGTDIPNWVLAALNSGNGVVTGAGVLTSGGSLKRVTDLDRVQAVQWLIKNRYLTNYANLLPILFNLKEGPLSLEDHFPFEPVFESEMPEETTLKSGRQCTKTTTKALKLILLSVGLPDLTCLYVAPLYEQTRRFSQNVVRPLIHKSPLRLVWHGTGVENNVLQRSFRNESKIIFSFAGEDADRIRGVSSDVIAYDEIQNLDPNHIPIIDATADHSKYRIRLFGGTPLTMDNLAQIQWDNSSQAEWIVRCTGCNKFNIPKMGYDLEKMIGPPRYDITPDNPGVVCAKCRRPIDPKRNGRWFHFIEDRRRSRPGYHIPQILLPHHYGDPVRWAELNAKMRGSQSFTVAKFYNEVLGESYDAGMKLVTQEELQRASSVPIVNRENDWQAQVDFARGRYISVGMGVDWGGGGDKRISFTAVAIVGMLPDGSCEVIYGRRLLTPHDPGAEVGAIRAVYRAFGCGFLAHDFTGKQYVREVLLHDRGRGIPRKSLLPMVYHAHSSQDVLVEHPAQHAHARHYWLLDKPKSLTLLCEVIRTREVKFFKWDKIDEDNRGLISDFLALVEQKIESSRAGDVYLINRAAAWPDDFAHAVNFACVGLWQREDKWPDLSGVSMPDMTQGQADAYAPMDPWADIAYDDYDDRY